MLQGPDCEHSGGRHTCAAQPHGIYLGSIYFPANFRCHRPTGKGNHSNRSAGAYEWVFPYFVGGIAFAGLISGASAPTALWKGASVFLPAMVLAYIYCLSRSGRAAAKSMTAASSEENYPVEVYS